jgi:hypothetical protein
MMCVNYVVALSWEQSVFDISPSSLIYIYDMYIFCVCIICIESIVSIVVVYISRKGRIKAGITGQSSVDSNNTSTYIYITHPHHRFGGHTSGEIPSSESCSCSLNLELQSPG